MLARRMAAKESYDDVYRPDHPTPYYCRYAATRLSVVEYPAALLRLALRLGLFSGPILDLGCGYGALGYLIRTGRDIESLYRRHLSEEGVHGDPLEIDRQREIIGVDRSLGPLQFASNAALVDRAIQMDLNAHAFCPTKIGRECAVSCSALLGYVYPSSLRTVLDILRPSIAFVTCVSWLSQEFHAAFEDCDFEVIKLSGPPVFQRWATESELTDMPDALIAGAHRADCYAISGRSLPERKLRECVEIERARRAKSTWLGAGRPGGCELG